MCGWARVGDAALVSVVDLSIFVAVEYHGTGDVCTLSTVVTLFLTVDSPIATVVA